jgi:hypothetical protein
MVREVLTSNIGMNEMNAGHNSEANVESVLQEDRINLFRHLAEVHAGANLREDAQAISESWNGATYEEQEEIRKAYVACYVAKTRTKDSSPSEDKDHAKDAAGHFRYLKTRCARVGYPLQSKARAPSAQMAEDRKARAYEKMTDAQKKAHAAIEAANDQAVAEKKARTSEVRELAERVRKGLAATAKLAREGGPAAKKAKAQLARACKALDG